MLTLRKGSQRPLRHDIAPLRRHQEGRWGYILAWLVGIPIPVLLLVYLLRGCS